MTRKLLPLFILFLLFTAIPFAVSGMLEQYHIDKSVLIGANILFFAISLLSIYIQQRGMANKNPHVFVRSVTGGMMVKMFFCVVAVVVYVFYSGKDFNKRAVFISLFLYLIYLFTEMLILMKMNRKPNA